MSKRLGLLHKIVSSSACPYYLYGQCLLRYLDLRGRHHGMGVGIVDEDEGVLVDMVLIEACDTDADADPNDIDDCDVDDAVVVEFKLKFIQMLNNDKRG